MADCGVKNEENNINKQKIDIHIPKENPITLSSPGSSAVSVIIENPIIIQPKIDEISSKLIEIIMKPEQIYEDQPEVLLQSPIKPIIQPIIQQTMPEPIATQAQPIILNEIKKPENIIEDQPEIPIVLNKKVMNQSDSEMPNVSVILAPEKTADLSILSESVLKENTDLITGIVTSNIKNQLKNENNQNINSLEVSPIVPKKPEMIEPLTPFTKENPKQILNLLTQKDHQNEEKTEIKKIVLENKSGQVSLDSSVLINNNIQELLSETNNLSPKMPENIKVSYKKVPRYMQPKEQNVKNIVPKVKFISRKKMQTRAKIIQEKIKQENSTNSKNTENNLNKDHGLSKFEEQIKEILTKNVIKPVIRESLNITKYQSKITHLNDRTSENLLLKSWHPSQFINPTEKSQPVSEFINSPSLEISGMQAKKYPYEEKALQSTQLAFCVAPLDPKSCGYYTLTNDFVNYRKINRNITNQTQYLADQASPRISNKKTNVQKMSQEMQCMDSSEMQNSMSLTKIHGDSQTINLNENSQSHNNANLTSSLTFTQTMQPVVQDSSDSCNLLREEPRKHHITKSLERPNNNSPTLSELKSLSPFRKLLALKNLKSDVPISDNTFFNARSPLSTIFAVKHSFSKKHFLSPVQRLEFSKLDRIEEKTFTSELLEKEYQNFIYYIQKIGNPKNGLLHLKKFEPNEICTPEFVIKLAKRMGVDEFKEPDLLWIFHLMINAPHEQKISDNCWEIKIGHHPSDLYFLYLLHHARKDKIEEFKILDETTQKRYIREKSWLQFKRGNKEYYYNFYVLRESRTCMNDMQRESQNFNFCTNDLCSIRADFDRAQKLLQNFKINEYVKHKTTKAKNFVKMGLRQSPVKKYEKTDAITLREYARKELECSEKTRNNLKIIHGNQSVERLNKFKINVHTKKNSISMSNVKYH